MFTPLSSVLYGMLLLAASSAPSDKPPLPTCETGTRHIELEADTPGQSAEICIRPGLSLSLLFDATLARVDIEGRERFRRVDEGAAFLSLVASEALHDGDRIPVRVSFQSDSAPTSASFTLVVHPSQAERQVEVARHERTVASYRQGERQARAEAQQCQEEMARFRAESGGRGGLADLILHDVLGSNGVTVRKLDAAQHPGLPLYTHRVISYRAVGNKQQGRVAVELDLTNSGTTAWTPAGAALVDPTREHLADMKVWPLEPLPPGKRGRLVVEMDAAEDEAQGPFTLKLWDEQGREGALLDGVTFP